MITVRKVNEITSRIILETKRLNQLSERELAVMHASFSTLLDKLYDLEFQKELEHEKENQAYKTV